jgi:hypothetical protein
MNSHFVSNGEWRLHRNHEFQSRLRALRDLIRERHAAELAKANIIDRVVIRWRMVAEYRQERRKIVPSKHSLYLGGIGKTD